MGEQRLHTEQPGQAQVDATDRLLALIRELVAELHPRQPVTVKLDSSLDRDLGLDSLGQVELFARLEQVFDVALPERQLAALDTVRDLLRLLQGAVGRPLTFKLAAASPGLATVDAAPLFARTLVEVLEWHVSMHPDRPHIRLYSDADDGEVITYGDLWQEAVLVAVGLQQQGLGSGEAVVIMLPTGREYFASFCGTLLAGGIPVPVYPPGRLKQIEEHLRRHTAILANCQARVMITMPEAHPFSRLLLAQVASLRAVLTCAELTIGAQPGVLVRPVIGPADIALLQYTSGSTGAPKGVILSHANLLANIRAMAEANQVTASDVFVSWLPLYHDMGLIGAWLGSLYFACHLVLMSPLAFIGRPQRWLAAIHRYGGTLSAAPNFAYDLCARRIDDQHLAGLDLSSWRIAFNGAEAVRPTTLTRFSERFAAYGFRCEAMSPVYGLAESSVGLAFPPLGRGPLIDRVQRGVLMKDGRAVPAAAGDTTALAVVNCGRPLPGHQIRIVDDADRELPEHWQGHLQFQGPSCTSGYLHNPEQTRRLFHGPWLDSGDLAYMAGGEVYITGRAKDIIIRAGRNIYPEELEEAIGQLAGIRTGNVAVFGSLAEDSATERLIVLAETRKKEPETLVELRAAINGLVTDLAGAAADEVVLAPPNTVPKTSSGKIRRGASRQLYESGAMGRPAQAVWLQVARFRLAGLPPALRQRGRRLQASLYAGWCWGLFGVAALLLWPLVVLLPVLGWRWQALRLAVRLLAWLAGIAIQVQGREHLPELGASCLYVSNHASYLDSLVLAGVLPPPLRFVAKAELRRGWLTRLPLSRLGTEFVERFDVRKSQADSQRLLAAADVGHPLVFFAEGTCLRLPGLLPFRLGAFTTAAQGGLTVVPLAIRGTRSILRPGSWFPRPGAVSVTIGPAITVEVSDDPWAGALRLRELARDWILQHCGEPDLEGERTANLHAVMPPNKSD
jgi:acyl carrier protein